MTNLSHKILICLQIELLPQYYLNVRHKKLRNKRIL